MRKLTHSELLERQAAQDSAKLPLCAVLNDVRSLYNVGSMFRTADGAGLEKLWLCGITGTPPQSKIVKTALGAERTVPWEYRKSAPDTVRELKANGYQIVLLEQMRESISYHLFQPKPPVCLVLGNEITGVSDELATLSDAAVEVEMAGLKNSLNVTVAFGIVTYHIRNELTAQLRFRA